ncbi:cytochrome P450 [Streptomyces rubradiris]|uniref:Cytochrome P450 n=1 Tax=Streptomyces rubradiris TaxID=285531 RepID=A0ABQ3R912_STRRR|nr:cytochrome P450 [Streptomyces rubradiris]GHG99203.1 cytochrome P450 [Streptomyces rubradiris]GHI52340.1 cytochrome P450 [Streptomyces rubradiris]
MRIGEKRRFRRDPLAYIDILRRRSGTEVFRLPRGGYCVRDADLAQTLLRSPEYNTGKSGFFNELLPTRDAQVEVGHAVRNLLRAGLPRYRAELTRAVTALPAVSRWPAAGNTLVHRCLTDLLLHPQSPVRTRGLTDQAMRGGVVFHAPRAWRRARAEFLRARLLTALTEEVRHRRRHPADEPRDVLDALLGACPPTEVTDRTLAELHLMMYRAIVVPISASLAWSVLLGCLHHTSDAPWPWPADQVVRETLRYRPVPWLLGRTVPHVVELGGVAFRPGDLLSASPYLMHHEKGRWTAPEEFRPERWEEPGEHGSYVPFGAGPYICAGAAVAQTLLTESLSALTRDARLTVTGGDTRAVISEGNVPRPFVLHRTPRHGGTEHEREGR